MLDGYHRIFYGHALKQVIREVEIPDPSLGIGLAERHEYQPLIFSYESAQINPPVLAPIKTSDDVIELGRGEMFVPSDFPVDYYIGEGL